MKRIATILLFVSILGYGCEQKQEEAYAPADEPVYAQAELFDVDPAAELMDEPANDTPPVVAQPIEEPVEETVPAEPIRDELPNPRAVAAVPQYSQPHHHTVMPKDTLYSIARQYYSDASKWRIIYEANRQAISDPNKINVGTQLMIP